MRSNGSSARAAIFLQPSERLRIERLDLPNTEPGEVLVRIEASTICGSDLHTIAGLREEPTPTILGHEAVGEIVELGEPIAAESGGPELQVGQRVVWSVCASCGACDRCQGGYPQKCRDLLKFGHRVAKGRTALAGGFAEYTLLPRGTTILPISRQLPASLACPASCATATVAAAIRLARPKPSDKVAVIGAGMLGLTAVAMLRDRNVQQITAIDIDRERLNWARRFGAEECKRWQGQTQETDVDGLLDLSFDVVLEMSGDDQMMKYGVDRSTVGGRVVWVGAVKPGPGVLVNPEQIVRRCIQIIGIHNYGPEDLLRAVEFLERSGGNFPLAALIQREFPLEQINAAIEYAQDQRPIRVMIRP